MRQEFRKQTASSAEQSATPLFCLTLICPSTSTKRLKDAIKAVSNQSNICVNPGKETATSRIYLGANVVTMGADITTDGDVFWSPSEMLAASSGAFETAPWLRALLSEWENSGEISIRLQFQRITEPQITSLTANPLLRALRRHFGPSIPAGLSTDLPRWETYTDFLLFSANAFCSTVWTSLPPSTLQALLSVIADEFSVTHIARKGAIARGDPSRRPRISPLYGDFTPPGIGEEEFDRMFWTRTRWVTPRGGIWYSWAPEFTMYSRGNGIEKTRVAMLDNVKGKTVLDMYAGIGMQRSPFFAPD